MAEPFRGLMFSTAASQKNGRFDQKRNSKKAIDE